MTKTTEMTVELINQVDELMELALNSCMKTTGGWLATMSNMSEEDAAVMSKTLKLYADSKKYCIELASQMDRIETKLDKLLAAQNRKEETP